MAGSEFKNTGNQGHARLMMTVETSEKHSKNETLALNVLATLAEQGVSDYCICPAGRNAPLVSALEKQENLTAYHWFEERSAAFFAIGKIKLTGCPVAVVTTSGTAAGELLPAVMEAYYSGLPLVLVTADRPRRYRGSGAPQTAEQVGLFGQYAIDTIDIAADELCQIDLWDLTGPLHINVCFEEPLDHLFQTDLSICPVRRKLESKNEFEKEQLALHSYLNSLKYPLVIVSALKEEAWENIASFLYKLQAPIYLEATSGLREHPLLQNLRIHRLTGIWQTSTRHHYPIDGVLRIGGVPTGRIWRDLENRKGDIQVFSVSDVPFSGLSWGKIHHVNMCQFFKEIDNTISQHAFPSRSWLNAEYDYLHYLEEIYQEEPQAEQALIHRLSKIIPGFSTVFLGNSLPIREWDAYASNESQERKIYASRGLNGIDGQISTFLGLCTQEMSNWGIFGDLTALYDLAAPWIIPQLPSMSINIVIVNNFGGKIFENMFKSKKMLNTHTLSFSSIASFWGLMYAQNEILYSNNSTRENRLIELVPNLDATHNFTDKVRAYER